MHRACRIHLGGISRVAGCSQRRWGGICAQCGQCKAVLTPCYHNFIRYIHTYIPGRYLRYSTQTGSIHLPVPSPHAIISPSVSSCWSTFHCRLNRSTKSDPHSAIMSRGTSDKHGCMAYHHGVTFGSAMRPVVENLMF